MKQYFSIAILALVALACTKEAKEIDSPAVQGLTITIANPELRTALGAEGTGTFQVLWSAGDCIGISETATSKTAVYQLVGDGGSSSGTFRYLSGDSDISTINDVVYPAGSNGNVPSSQSYVAGTYDPAAAILSFHSDAGVSVNSNVTLHHATSYVCLQLKGKSGQSIKSIVAKAAGASFTLSCATPVALGATAVPFFVAIPAVSSVDAELDITLGDDSVVKKVSLGKTFSAGHVHRFPEAYVIDRGDLYQGGMVYQTEYESGYVMLVSVDQGNCAFSTEEINCGTANNPEEGFDNTAILQALENYATAYPAAKWCTDHGAGWYLPSRKEIARLYNNLLAASGSIGQARTQALLAYYGGTAFTLDKYYCTSCESQNSTKYPPEQYVWLIKTNADKTAYQGKKVGTNRLTRALKKITL